MGLMVIGRWGDGEEESHLPGGRKKKKNGKKKVSGRHFESELFLRYWFSALTLMRCLYSSAVVP